MPRYLSITGGCGVVGRFSETHCNTRIRKVCREVRTKIPQSITESLRAGQSVNMLCRQTASLQGVFSFLHFCPYAVEFHRQRISHG